MEAAAADAITRSSATLEHSLSGSVILTATDGIGDWWLPATMHSFYQKQPYSIIMTFDGMGYVKDEGAPIAQLKG